MAILKQISAGRVRIITGGIALFVLSGLSASLPAQTVMQRQPPPLSSFATGGGPAFVLYGAEDLFSLQVETTAAPDSDLPDAPLPAALLRRDGETSPEIGESSSAQTPQQQDKQQQGKQPKPGGQNPQAQPGTPSLSDLGLTPQQVHGDNKEQELLDKRTEMLKIHQRLGLITLIPVAAACISSVGAPPEHGNYGNTTSRDVHVAIGGVAVGLYAATAFYAIRAPKVSNESARGGIKLHKYLIYLHAPGMVLTPILGAMAFNQINSGQKVHGIASAHSAVAVVTAASYGAAIVAVSWPIHLKF